GDVDGDGDLDLVVLDRALGGVHVFKSSVSEQMTAVLTPAAAQPVQHRLGDSYPNPFNPAVVIPLDLATDAARVSLTVYDVLGRRVRQVWQGPLQAGSHRFTWDGRDEQGKEVAAGVYVYQVEIDGQVEAKKTTKLP
ncbi:MAG: T9SS type A sorting domain-containing protein, partial [Gemmatimonadetes bacterium]|nr:T9SS type A sorting domain-containing protein [Gemmatimonadota bacterium]